MDFLDPKKLRRHAILLFSGYFLIGVAIVIATIVLVYQANGFGVNRDGEVVQNGLVFFSSQPHPADIYVNGKLNQAKTNVRLSLPAGQYDVRLARDGYRDWTRSLAVLGGDVQHFDYPVLFPKKLDVTNQQPLAAAPGIVSQSLDRRWLLVQSGTTTTFNFYDLKNPGSQPVAIALPANMVSEAATAHTWAVVQWADDNQHVLLTHTLSTGTEYILVDRTDAAKTVNLNKLLGADPVKLTLVDNKYDQYDLLGANNTLSAATLSNTTPAKILENILAYKTYGSKTLLYATTTNAPAGKVNVIMQNDSHTYPVRTIAASSTYLLDAAGYRGVLYVVVGSGAENAVYIYQDPIGQLQSDSTLERPSASRVLRVTNPSYEAFSQTAQYVMAEDGTQFSVYDLYLHRSYSYTLTQPLDVPQPHAAWMDGNRLDYVSGGKLFVLDYDHQNQQVLMDAGPVTGAYFAPDYRFVYTLTADASGTNTLTQTSLLAPGDR
jgi:hypothetical protein